jgi:hypothetical protein
MNYDHDKVDEVALALLFLTLGEPMGDNHRAWKGMAWEVSNRLYEKGWIEDPRNKNESLVLTQSGREACIRLFKEHFWKPANTQDSLFPLPIDMKQLVWLYQLPESELTFWVRYLDSATGEIMAQEYDEETHAPRPASDFSADPRYLPIPVQSDAAYLEDVREYAAALREGDLKSALFSVLEHPASATEAVRQIRSLLHNHEKWEKWYGKRTRQRLLDWLASHGIEPR